MDFMKKPVLIGLAIAFLVTTLVGTGFYFSRKDDVRAQPTSVRVEVDKVRRGSLTREMTVVGTLEADNFVTMKAQVKGLISKVHVVGGESVSKGNLLFEIDDRIYAAQVKEAQALLDLAESAFERQKKLGAKNFGTGKSLDETRAQFLKAQAQLDKAQKDLDDTKIMAPFEGIVGLHRISQGTPISADLELISITDMDPMKVNFKMPSKYVPYLNLGQRVVIEVDSYPGQKFEGHIEGIDAQVDTGAQSIAVQATLSNPKNLLKPGMFVRVKVTVGSKDDTLIVPEESIIAVGDQTYVWRVIEHPQMPGTYVALKVQVLTGIQDKDRIEVTRNLKEDEIIITVGHQKVTQDGIPVSFDLASVDLTDPEEDAAKAVEKAKEEAKKAAEIREPAKEVVAVKDVTSEVKAEGKDAEKSAEKAVKKPAPKKPTEKPAPLGKKSTHLRSLFGESKTSPKAPTSDIKKKEAVK